MHAKKFALLVTVATSCLLQAAPVAAQVVGETVLEEFVVTARRQSETLVQSPVSVTALSAESLQEKGIDNFQDLARYTPGLNFANQQVSRNDRSFHRFQSRGIYEGTTVFIDGVAVAAANTGGINDTAQVEVLNGPQSATFGRASFGGAINFITQRPRFDFGGSAEATVASRDTYEVSGMVEGPLIGDVLAGKLMVRHFERGDIYDNFSLPGGLGAQKTDALVASVLFEPNESFQAYYRGAWWRDRDGSPAQAQLTPADYNCATPTSATGALNYICGEISRAPKNRMVQANTMPQSIIDYVTARRGPGTFVGDAKGIDGFGMLRKAQHHALTWNYDLPWDMGLKGSFGYATDGRSFITDTSFQNGLLRPTPGSGVIPQRNPAYQNPANANAVGFESLLPYFSRTAAGSEQQEAKSAEIQFATNPDKPFTALVGLSYLEIDYLSLTNAFNNTGFANPGLLTQRGSETLGIFGSFSYRFDFGLKLIAEGRIQRDDIEERVLTAGGRQSEGRFNSETPRFIAQYEPNANLNFYVSYSEGVRPGLFNGSMYSRDPRIIAYVTQFQAPGVDLLVPEERVKMTEIGFKGNFFDRRLMVAAAAYKVDWVDRQVPQNVSYPGTPAGDPNPLPPTLFQVFVSDGAAELEGVEVQGRFQATPEIQLEATYAYTGSKVVFDNCSPCLILTGQSNPVGNRLGGFPAHSGSFSASYEREMFQGWDGFARVDYSYRGRIYADSSLLTWTAPGHTVNTRIGLRGERYGVELFASNLFNNDAPTSVGRNVDAFTTTLSTVVVSPPDPRIVGLRVTARY